MHAIAIDGMPQLRFALQGICSISACSAVVQGTGTALHCGYWLIPTPRASGKLPFGLSLSRVAHRAGR